MKDSKFTVIDDLGNERVYDILFTFDNEETKKSYIIYTDNSLDRDGNIEVYASTYEPENPNSSLGEIKSEKEWKVIEAILSSIEESIKEKGE